MVNRLITGAPVRGNGVFHIPELSTGFRGWLAGVGGAGHSLGNATNDGGVSVNETMVTIVGNAATDVRYSTTSAGVPLASFRLASTERRYDRQQGAWVDGETSFVTVWAWRWMAENVVSSVSKGDPLLVAGKLRVREREQDGKRTVTVDIDAWALGHDLSRGTSAFRRAVRARPELVEQQPSWERADGGGAAVVPPGRVVAPV